MKLKRYFVFIAGLFISSLAVSIITHADLGTSPISAIPYVSSLSFPLSLGAFTVIFSLFLIFLQFILLRKDFTAEHLLQIPISIAFGYFIDLTMVPISAIPMNSYFVQIIWLLIGCAILAVGVYFEVIANVAMLPGESFVNAVKFVFHTDFGITKVCFDVSMTVIAAIISFALAGTIAGVREGTVIAAVLVGFITRFYKKYFINFEKKLFPANFNNTANI